jgi:hypothetical protein
MDASLLLGAVHSDWQLEIECAHLLAAPAPFVVPQSTVLNFVGSCEVFGRLKEFLLWPNLLAHRRGVELIGRLIKHYTDQMGRLSDEINTGVLSTRFKTRRTLYQQMTYQQLSRRFTGHPAPGG